MGISKKILGIIPARYASTRFPGKLLAQIMGKSVLQRTYACASACPDLNALIIATDDERIAEHVNAFGGKAYMTPSCSSGTERAACALDLYPELQEYGVVCVIQGDEPCFSPAVLNKALELLAQDEDAVMATAAAPVEEEAVYHSSVVKCVVDASQNALYFSRSPIPYRKNDTVPALQHIGIYCFRKDFLRKLGALAPTPLQQAEDLEQLKILEHGFRIKVALLEPANLTPHVDVPEDLQKVEKFLCD